MSEIAVRLLREVGTSAFLRVYWGIAEWDNGKIVRGSCPNGYGRGGPGVHDSTLHLEDSSCLEDWELGGETGDYPRSAWSPTCDHCPAAWVADLPRIACDCGVVGCTKRNPMEPSFQMHHRRLYRASDGSGERIREEFQPGDLFWSTWYPCGEGGPCPQGWTNCNGRHLWCVLPDGHRWDIMGRASNCTLTGDTLHRCWVLHGDPERGELVHVDKAGLTCTAGAGSILSPLPGQWHGFLHRGKLRKC
jgi:hypothetical protein